MDVLLDGVTVKCHCPTTGGIGDVDTKNIAGLVSKSEDAKRKFPYTVEAVSCDKRFTNISSHSKNHIGPAQIIKKPVRQCRLQRKMFIEKWYLILYQIQDDTVYVDYILDCRKDYSWLI